MAEALVNVLLERLATITLNKVVKEFKLVIGVENEVKSLTRNLEAIRAVLEDAEQRQVTEATVRRWLTELTEVSFDMDDVLDEWITEVLKRQMEKQEQQCENNALILTTKNKVRFPCFSSCFRVRQVKQVNQLMLRHDTAVRIKELNERIESIAKEKQNFSFQNIIRIPQLPQRQKTTSLPNVKTFGRDTEKSLVVSKLLSESSEGNEVPLIIPIVGMGGMGKTTLAQLVYNDENVKSHFDMRVWVCVSDPFEEIKIAQAIIEEIAENNSSKKSTVLQTLNRCINESVKGKKFLLVLDDVWNPKHTQWEELIKPFRSGAIGSRILVTTRKEEVASLMKATTQLIPMKELGETFCLSLFYYSANIDESSASREFHNIGLELVKRCKGLPLVAKTLGSLMRNKKTIREWQAVLESKIWELKEIEQEVFQPLLLSYHDLDPSTKCCLLYCVLFPKDYVYNRNTLIELWMAQDYLNTTGSKERAIVGQNYFEDLVMRSFFQDVEIDDENLNITCKLHDIVHEFLQYLSKNEYLIVDFEKDSNERNDISNDKVYHLTLVNKYKIASSADFLLNYKKLHTFTTIDLFNKSLCPILELIVQLKCPRTLNLCRPGYDDIRKIGGERSRQFYYESFDSDFRYHIIPKKIGEMIHLRYLDLSGNTKVEELPDTIGSLYNLQTLRLVGCSSLHKLDVGRLINLRHLYVLCCRSLTSIKGIGKLTNLQRLDEFITQIFDGENKWEDLRDLNQLRGSLSIQIWQNADRAAEKANMVNKAHLLQLLLFFDRYDRGHFDHKEIMNALEPHQGLERLTIDGYRGSAFSDWLLSLHCLRVLSIGGHGDNCEVLPPLGKLPSLESLRIKNLKGVKNVGVEFLGIDGQTSSSILISFPKLKQLTIQDMDSWEEWEGADHGTITIMTCLSELTISNCNKLQALPDFLCNKLDALHKVFIGAPQVLDNLYSRGRREGWAKFWDQHEDTVLARRVFGLLEQAEESDFLKSPTLPSFPTSNWAT